MLEKYPISIPRPSRGLLVARTVELLVEEGVNASQSFTLRDKETLIVGRGSNSDTKLDDPVMSRCHFSIVSRGNKIVIDDLSSSTGTFLNGQRISEAEELRSSDEVIAGNTKFSVSIKGGSDEDTLLPAKTKIWAELSRLKGTELGGFELREIIGAGKSGLVFDATETKKNRRAAVKVFSGEYTRDGEHRERFVRGMQAFCKIKHPNFIRLHQAGKSSNFCYAAMEFIDGESLSALINRAGIGGKLDWKEVWRCARHVSGALLAAWDHEIIHRNLVPSNILRRTEDKAYLLGDFTLAKPLESSGHDVTQADQILGDIQYLPPERVSDAATTDTRSDIYGLGAVCYALLTGRPPSIGNSLTELLESIRSEVPPLPSTLQMGVNDHFESAVMKMIAKRPEDRFQSPHAVIKELDRIGNLNGLTAN